nr:hypothetical protein [Kofleriaceae bacterium]
MRGSLVLARWLGPWAGTNKSPRVPVRDDVVGGLRVRVFGASDARRGYVVAPGLHYAGPDDPRLDRFCRVLAAAGHVVVAPFVPSYLRLVPDAAAVRDFTTVVAERRRWCGDRPVAVFSISFGSLLAFAAAAELGDELDGVTAFGGYADFHETMKFCLAGETGSGRVAVRDPLNQSVVLINLLPMWRPELDARQQADLAAGWRRFVEATWGRPELKTPERFVPIAEALAPSVPADVRELFLIGVGARPGALELANDALARYDARPLDPSPWLARVRGRVDLVHGADDDVIPFEQTHALAAKLRASGVDARVHITGLYGHTGASRPTLRSAATELATMTRILRLLAR